MSPKNDRCPLDVCSVCNKALPIIKLDTKQLTCPTCSAQYTVHNPGGTLTSEAWLERAGGETPSRALLLNRLLALNVELEQQENEKRTTMRSLNEVVAGTREAIHRITELISQMPPE